MFDPNLPQAGTEIDAVQMRGQLNGLKALIDALNALAISGALVESVGTSDPGDPATAGVSLVTGVLRFSFVLPRGDTGPQGATGPAGPPFANAIVDGVTTLPAGTPATVSVTYDGANVHFTFGIPQGDAGPTGDPGPPGEVSNADLTTAINGTSSNTNTVSTLNQTAAGTYDAAQLQLLFDKMDELIAALRR